MYIRLGKTTTWQDKRINAMNRIISKNKFKTEHFIEEYNRVCVSNAKTKREYKGENNVSNN